MAFDLKNIETTKEEKSSFDINSILKKEISFGNSFSNKKKEAFYTELSVLLEAGLTLKEALTLTGEEQKKEQHQKLFQRIIEEIILGKSLSETIEDKKEFSEYEYHSLKIGEQTGTLLKVSRELGEFFRRKNEQRRIILSSLSYPIVVLSTAFLAILFMLQFVVPMFADIFRQNQVELPWITIKIMNLSNLFQKYWLVFFLSIIGISITIQLIKNKKWYQKYKSLLVLKTPVIGEFIRKVKIAQFTQAITLLTGAKIPLLNGLQLTKKMMGYYPLELAISIIEYDILQGKSLHESMSKHKIFDKKMVSLIKVADETNQNETIFQRLTTQYNQEIEHQSKLISSTLEPFIILILGVVVATILIAMYLPMFKLSTVIS